MSDWICYLIMSLDSNDTYVGSSNNQPKRLNDHNNNNPNIKRKGAKRTRGQTWVPILIISGFENKNACLSFESGFKRLAFRRNNNRLLLINKMSDQYLLYTKDTKWNRIMDLIYFMHNFTFIGNKFMINYDIRHPVNQPDNLIINVFMETWIKDLPWPYFVSVKKIT
jgi:predicted GIY-YIG superfamily endonuclease